MYKYRNYNPYNNFNSLQQYQNEKDFMFKQIKGIIEQGISTMRKPNVTQQDFELWANYSKEALSRATNNAPKFYFYYLELIFEVNLVRTLLYFIPIIVGSVSL